MALGAKDHLDLAAFMLLAVVAMIGAQVAFRPSPLVVGLFVLPVALLIVAEATYDVSAGLRHTESGLPDRDAGASSVAFVPDAEIYDLKAVSDPSLRALRVYVPVGLWEDNGVNDPKAMWLRAIQRRLGGSPESLDFLGAYGIPPREHFGFPAARRVLEGFVGTHCEVRVFPALMMDYESEGLPTAAPGLGILFAEYADGTKALLVGCASKAGAVRIDSAVRIVDQKTYEVFRKWFDTHVTKIGVMLDLSSKLRVSKSLDKLAPRPL